MLRQNDSYATYTSKEWHTTHGPNKCWSGCHQEQGVREEGDEGDAWSNSRQRSKKCILLAETRMATGNRKILVTFRNDRFIQYEHVILNLCSFCCLYAYPSDSFVETRNRFCVNFLRNFTVGVVAITLCWFVLVKCRWNGDLAHFRNTFRDPKRLSLP
jgi:hypothetical protein